MKQYAMKNGRRQEPDPGAWQPLASLQAVVDAGSLAAQGRLTVAEVLSALPSGMTLVVEAETHAMLAADPAWSQMSVEMRQAPLGLTHVGVLRGNGREVYLALRVPPRPHPRPGRPRQKVSG